MPGTAGRVNPNEQIPYCNLTDAQFSFHGHRDAIKFFLSVPSQTIQRQSTSTVAKTASTADKPSYEQAETILILSGGHGYIDFRIGDTNNPKENKEQLMNDIKTELIENDKVPNKNDRSHLIVWQINN